MYRKVTVTCTGLVLLIQGFNPFCIEMQGLLVQGGNSYLYREVTLTFFPDHSHISTSSLPLSSASSVNDDTSINKKKTHLSVRHFKEKFSFKMIFYTYLNYDNLKVNINKINDRFTFSYDFVLIKQLSTLTSLRSPFPCVNGNSIVTTRSVVVFRQSK